MNGSYYCRWGKQRPAATANKNCQETRQSQPVALSPLNPEASITVKGGAAIGGLPVKDD